MAAFNPPPSSKESFDAQDEFFMRKALAMARVAGEQGEVPVGAVLVSAEVILAESYNQPIALHDPTAHAEIQALRAAARKLGNYRLPGTVLYVTLEPCLMCAGALVTARIRRLVFAARDLRFGAVRSKFRAVDSELLNHSVQIHEGLLAADAAALLTNFFQRKRDSGGEWEP
jgi:tRNA(adenine34) deaminase